MTNLIPIKTNLINGQHVQTVDARELHSFLESKQDFSTWIKKRVAQYGFTENVDFLRLHKKMEANNASLIEYTLTLDTAKELSMVERNEKGKQARQYFIECERRAKKAQPIDISHILTDPNHLKTLLLDNVTKVIELQEIVKEQEPKVKALEKLSRADGLLCITDAAKALEMRPKELFEYLQQRGWIYRRAGGKNFIPYQKAIQAGLMDCHATTFVKTNGSEFVVVQAKITPKGLATLSTDLQIKAIN